MHAEFEAEGVVSEGERLHRRVIALQAPDCAAALAIRLDAAPESVPTGLVAATADHWKKAANCASVVAVQWSGTPGEGYVSRELTAESAAVRARDAACRGAHGGGRAMTDCAPRWRSPRSLSFHCSPGTDEVERT